MVCLWACGDNILKRIEALFDLCFKRVGKDEAGVYLNGVGVFSDGEEALHAKAVFAVFKSPYRIKCWLWNRYIGCARVIRKHQGDVVGSRL